jgi:hypothetical protein
VFHFLVSHLPVTLRRPTSDRRPLISATPPHGRLNATLCNRSQHFFSCSSSCQPFSVDVRHCTEGDDRKITVRKVCGGLSSCIRSSYRSSSCQPPSCQSPSSGLRPPTSDPRLLAHEGTFPLIIHCLHLLSTIVCHFLWTACRNSLRRKHLGARKFFARVDIEFRPASRFAAVSPYRHTTWKNPLRPASRPQKQRQRKEIISSRRDFHIENLSEKPPLALRERGRG